MKITQEGEGYKITLECEGKSLPLWALLVNLERGIIGQALAMFDGSKAKSADFLQLNRTTLVEKAKKYGFPGKKTASQLPDGYNDPTNA